MGKSQSSKCKQTKMRRMQVEEENQYGGRQRSYGKQGRKKFPFSCKKASLGIGKQTKRSPKVAGKKLRRRQFRLQVKKLEAELALMKIRDSAELLEALIRDANHAEEVLEGLITTRNEARDNLLKMKAMEANLMLELGFD